MTEIYRRETWKCPVQKTLLKKKKNTGSLETKKTFDELKKKFNEPKPKEVELSRLLSSIKERSEALEARVIQGDDGRLQIVPGYNNNRGYGCDH